jgi:hypothetical protein
VIYSTVDGTGEANQVLYLSIIVFWHDDNFVFGGEDNVSWHKYNAAACNGKIDFTWAVFKTSAGSHSARKRRKFQSIEVFYIAYDTIIAERGNGDFLRSSRH